MKNLVKVQLKSYLRGFYIPGDNADDGTKRDFPGGVDAGDGVNDGRRGKQRQDGEEEDVNSLEQHQFGEIRGQHRRHTVVCPRALDCVVEDVAVPHEVGEEEVEDLDVCQVDGGEGDDNGYSDQGKNSCP